MYVRMADLHKELILLLSIATNCCERQEFLHIEVPPELSFLLSPFFG